MVTKENESWTNHRKNWNRVMKKNNPPGRISTWGNLDTRERRDRELIKEYLNEAPDKCETNEEASMKNIWRTKLKTENEEVFWNDGLRRNTMKRIQEILRMVKEKNLWQLE